MLKGKTVIELRDVHTGQVEVFEDTNLVTEAAADILNTNIQGMLYDNPYFNSVYGDDWMLPLKRNIMGGILLYQNEIEERSDNIYAPMDNPIIGYASDDVNSTVDVRRGSRNLTESKVIDGGYRFVWDFATSQANGTISAICLTNTLAGRGTQNSGYYMIRLGSWGVNAQSKYSVDCYRDNKRIYIEEGYRLELTTHYNSKQAKLCKYKDDHLHASLVDRPITRIVTTPVEETIIELGHYPLYYHYTGGTKDGKEEMYSSSTDVRTYLYHAADGKWYGLVRRENRKFDRISYGNEVYNTTGYQWYMDIIDGGTVTTVEISAPSGTTDFYSIGMSGKWLMCVNGNNNRVYRIDTTNPANIEQVPNFSYNSSHQYTYIINDDIVISGWYFLDGEPKLYLRESGDQQNYVAWGRSQMARYKTYGVREWMYRSGSDYHLYKELFLFTPYLATINNLESPVIKTADKTMKITYTVTEIE